MNADELTCDNKRLRILNGRLCRLALDNGVTQARLDALASDINAGLPELIEIVRTSQGGPAVEAELQRSLDVANRTIKSQSDVLADIKAEIAALDGVNEVARELEDKIVHQRTQIQVFEEQIADLKTQLAVSNGKIVALAEGASPADKSDAAVEAIEDDVVEATADGTSVVTTRRSASSLRDKFHKGRARGAAVGQDSDSVFGKKD